MPIFSVSLELMLELANISKCIFVNLTNKSDFQYHITKIAQSIWSRKCNHLVFTRSMDACLSIPEIEKLVQVKNDLSIFDKYFFS